MNKTLRNTVIATWMGIVGVSSSAKADGAASRPQMTVCVRNYAQVPAATLSKAENIAMKIYERAGIETTWMDVALPSQGVSPNESVPAACATGGPRVNVSIIPAEMAAALGLPGNVLGLAPGKAEEHNRTVVFVFDQIANELVRQQNIADKSYILGHAMAHEIGHILTHMEQHSQAGIMQANWKKADFHAMMIGNLNFEPDQAERIQAEVARRIRQRAAIEMASLQ